jgi:hypothetical protein
MENSFSGYAQDYENGLWTGFIIVPSATAWLK